ncbi:MAG: hypothetical protein WDZ30_10945 [Cellvibrionaceae bacterium]
MQKLLGILLSIVSLALFLAGGAAIIAIVHALTVESTLAAIESAYGTLVIAIFLIVLGRFALKAAMARLSGVGGKNTPGPK